jgi:hypothetical protein
MSGLVSSEILTTTPSQPGECVPPPPPPLVRGEDTLAGWRGGRGSIVRKTPDSALYSIYLSTLWCRANKDGHHLCMCKTAAQ